MTDAPDRTPNADEIARLERLPSPVIAFASDYPPGYRIVRHRHERDQLLHAVSGVMSVRTDDGLWVTPPGRALWVPAGVHHAITGRTPLAMRTVYLKPGLVGAGAARCRVLAVTPLAREVIVRLTEAPPVYEPAGPTARLVAVLLDEIGGLAEAPLALPLPADPRLRPVVDALVAAPTDERHHAEWARRAGLSARSLSRAFRSGTGMSFGLWRQHLRLLAGVERLAAGAPVIEAALAAGYDSPSAFAAAFRRVTGTTPRRFASRDSA